MTGTFHTENWSAKFDAQHMHMFCNFGLDLFSKNGLLHGLKLNVDVLTIWKGRYAAVPVTY